jgi:hypothetical protein
MDKSYNSRFQTVARKFARLSAVVGAAALLSSCVSSFNKSHEPSQSQPVVQQGAGYSAALSESQVPDGTLVWVNVTFSQPYYGKVTATFEDKTFELYSLDLPVYEEKHTNFYVQDAIAFGSHHFQGIFGVVHDHKPGPAVLKVIPEGRGQPTELKFDIVDANYPSETLKVADRKVNPRKKDMIRIKRELAEINQIYPTETLKRYWSGQFVAPVTSATTDNFGAKRLYNGQLKNFHGGMDFKAAMGTPIHASGAGVVMLAKDMFYSGGTVIIDHGYGLLTMYFHMSRIDVKKGQTVSQKQLLGLSGKSGRVTGPHLHFQVVVHQIKVNPKGLLQEPVR